MGVVFHGCSGAWLMGDKFKKVGEVVVANVGVDEFFTGAVHDADVHLVGMEINSAVEFSGGGVVFHGCSGAWLMGVIWTPVDCVNAGKC